MRHILRQQVGQHPEVGLQTLLLLGQALQAAFDEGRALAERQLLPFAGHEYFLAFRGFASACLATKPESSPWWKKIVPFSSSPLRMAQPRPWAGSISSLPSQVHSMAGSPSRVVRRQSI
jgi:hypothetical protein